jgi:hypothetical protein
VPVPVVAAGSAPVAAAPAIAPTAPAPVPMPHAPVPVPPAAPGPAPFGRFDVPPIAPAMPGPTGFDAPHVAPARWGAFERLGLRAPAIDHQKLSKHVVSAYRLLGFAILTIIVVILVGYIAQTTFFYMSSSWIVPEALTPTDQRVVELQSQLSERQDARDRTAADLADAERAITVQQAFQSEFAKAIQSDLDGRKAALARMHELATEAAVTRRHIRSSNTAYARASAHRMAQEYAAGLIDRHDMLNGSFQLAQIDSSNLSLRERQADYEDRAEDLEAQTRSLEALLANTPSDAPMSYDVLKIKQEYETSRLDTQRAIGQRDALAASLAREDKLLDKLEQSAYLRAITDHATVAFVPYANLGKLAKGKSLYACRVGMMWCRNVGEVLAVLPGEVQFKDPHKDNMLRGQMVELKLDDGEAATDDVLFVGHRPLYL